MEDVKAIRNGDDGYKVEKEGRTIGFITKWYDRGGLVNTTGMRRFTANPLGVIGDDATFETLTEAVKYLSIYSDSD